MRAFIAIELPQETKEMLGHLEEKLKVCAADVKWVAPKNIHLTLKFLGERDEKKIEKTTQILEEVAGNKSCFQMRLSSLGAFPNLNFPKVIWTGIDKGDTDVKEIAKDLEEKIAKIGIPKEDRPFSSHITIGRTRSALNRDKLTQYLANTADDLTKKPQEFLVTKITLFKSTLTPNGPIYEPLKEAHLKTT